MLVLRSFSPDVEALAAAWRDRVPCVQQDHCRHTSQAGSAGGEASGYFVTSGPINGYAKPSMIDTTPQPYSRAAHEKIAADLAHDLGLPLPPAVLHRWNTPPTRESTLSA